jgi:hypothetical protein
MIKHDDSEACLNLFAYLVKDAIYQAEHGETDSDSFDAIAWLMTVCYEELGFDWWCTIAGINPAWARRLIFKDIQVLKSPKFRSPCYLINSKVL